MSSGWPALDGAPLLASGGDCVMRCRLHLSLQGTFSTVVKVPDQYGVFKWVLTYHRRGYSYIDLVEVRCAVHAVLRGVVQHSF